jgi:outer membrane protein assembly factor BamD
VLCAWLAAALTAACKSGPEARPHVSYKVSAQENYIKGQAAFDDGDFAEAIEYFNFVKSKFPLSSYAVDADLKVADCEFGREKYLESAEAYTNFIKLHPKHPKVPYASYRIGLCFVNRMPTDWFILPPAYELDQEETERAIRELERYLRQFPTDQNAADGRAQLDNCLRRMADRATYIMEFYFKRGHSQAVVWRADQILSKYSNLGYDERALFRKGQALIALKQPVQAREALGQLVQKFPKGDFASRANDLLGEIGSAGAPASTAAAGSAPK